MTTRRVFAGLSVAVLAAGLLVVDATPGSATTTSVATETQYRDALTALSGDSSGPHVIEVTADITIAGASDPTYNGDRPLTLNGNGHTIDGNGNSRILEYDSRALLTVNDLLLTGGAVFGVDSESGGAIRAGEDSVSINRSTFIGNTGDFGAAIASGSITITDSTFTDNTTPGGDGHAVHAASTLTVTGSTFTNNNGGALNGDTVSVTNSTLTGNTALFGAAVKATAVTLRHATLVDNEASSEGANVRAGSLTSAGSVVAGPMGGTANCAISGTITSNGHNYSDDASCGFTGAPIRTAAW